MTFGLLTGLFLFILAAVSAAGYVFVLRPSKSEGASLDIPAGLSRNQQDLPAAQAAIVDTFRALGDSLPLPGDRDAFRSQLIDGGLPLACGSCHISGHQSGLGNHVWCRRRLGGGGQRRSMLPR